jgi:hypothetical protein
MFTGATPGKVWTDIRVLVLSVDGNITEYSWGASGFCVATDEFIFTNDHRLRKFSESLSRIQQLAQEFLSVAFRILDPASPTPITTLGLVKLYYITADPGEPPCTKIVRTGIAVKEFGRGLTGDEAEMTLAQASFAWRLSYGEGAQMETAEIALLAGVTLRRLGRSDASALGRLREFVTNGVRLDAASCYAFEGLVQLHLESEECSVYLALLADLRDGRSHAINLHPAFACIAPISVAGPWPELSERT